MVLVQTLRHYGDGSLSPFLSLALHLREAGVVVGELVEIGEGDLADQDGIVSGHVRRRVAATVLQFDVHSHAELLHVETAPIDTEPIPDLFGLLGAEMACGGLTLLYPLNPTQVIRRERLIAPTISTQSYTPRRGGILTAHRGTF